MSKYPVTIIEAPYGFGKTTAVREYSKQVIDQSVRFLWYTSLGESDVKVWSGICDLLKSIDEAASYSLANLDISVADIFIEMVSIIRKFECPEETYIVIDNSHLISGHIINTLLSAFTLHTVANLHIVIMTQQMEIDSQYTYNNKVHRIEAGDFLFDKVSIINYFKLYDVKINREEIERINKQAAGWVVAIQLSLINYLEKGLVEPIHDIWQVLETALWQHYSENIKEILMSLALIDKFTEKQVAFISDQNGLSKEVNHLLKTMPFVTYDPEHKYYYMHNILQKFLKHQLYVNSNDELKEVLLKLMGNTCLVESDYYHGVKFFSEIKDYEAILMLPLREDYFEYSEDWSLMESILETIKYCDSEILRQHPMSLITFAFQFILYGYYEEYGQLANIIYSIIGEQGDLSSSEWDLVRGEMAFVQSFIAYNNIEEMVDCYKNAYGLLKGPSRFKVIDSSWTYGGVSVVYMFWNKVGALAQTVICVEDNLSYYTKLTGGHGIGGDCVMAAERLMLMGLDQEAEVLCHKAIYKANTKKQRSVVLCSELILCKIAIVRGNVNEYKMLTESLSNALELPGTNTELKRSIELSLASLEQVINHNYCLPDWLANVEIFSSEVFPALHSYCHIIYCRYLLDMKEYNKLLGLTSLFINIADDMNYVLPRIYMYIYMAIAKRGQGVDQDARGYLLAALNLGLSDQVYLPFAENAKYLLPMMEEWSDLFSSREVREQLVELCQRQLKGIDVISKSVFKRCSLTPREKEVALLAKEGHSVKQIADILFVAEGTVKTILKNVYVKLDVHSRIELAKTEI